MELDFSNNKITFQKELNDLDTLVLDFTCILDKVRIKYVLISGYVAILFGRSRNSEDVDLFLEVQSFEKFQLLWNSILKKFLCINASDAREAYDEYLKNGSAIRFCRKEVYMPNMEVKFPKEEIDFWTLKERKEVIVNGHTLYISPLELQIAYKLFLGSEKDLEDARHLYKVFKGHLNEYTLESFKKKLKIGEKTSQYLWKSPRLILRH